MNYLIVSLETLEVCRDERGKIVSVGSHYLNELPPSLAIDPNTLYGPKEVAAILHVSYFTALRRMAKMPGCTDIGKKKVVPGKRRPKRMLRISGMRLMEYLRNHPANPFS